MDECLFRGLVLRVERGGEILHEEAWGQALCSGADSLPMETSTIFDLASVSKLFTMTAVLRLASRGKLALADKVSDLLPGGDALALRRISAILGSRDLASLLTHSSGIHYWHPFYTRMGESFETILADVLEEHPLDDGVIYSDLNFMVLGRIVEELTGLPLAAAMGDLVLGPLGLVRSSYARPLGPAAAGQFGNRIERGMVEKLGLSFHRWRDESQPIRDEVDDGNCHYYFGGAAGHAGVFSDARDLCRVGRLYLDGGGLDGRAHLAPFLAQEAMRDHGGLRGLGFQLGENYPGGGCGHTGFTGSYLHVNRPAGLVIAILANRLHVGEPGDLNPFRRELSEAVLSAFR